MGRKNNNPEVDEEIDEETGEVKQGRKVVGVVSLDEVDFDALMKAGKDDELEQVSEDFWKPKLGEEIRGVFLGSEFTGSGDTRRIFHSLATKGKKGEIVPVRMLGSTGLNRMLKTLTPGKAFVSIRLAGEKPLAGGKTFKEWEVRQKTIE